MKTLCIITEFFPARRGGHRTSGARRIGRWVSRDSRRQRSDTGRRNRRRYREYQVGAFFMGGKNLRRCQLIQQLVRNWPRMKEARGQDRDDRLRSGFPRRGATIKSSFPSATDPPMTTDTSERGLERHICEALTGDPCDPPSGQTVGEPPSDYGGVGWSPGQPPRLQPRVLRRPRPTAGLPGRHPTRIRRPPSV